MALMRIVLSSWTSNVSCVKKWGEVDPTFRRAPPEDAMSESAFQLVGPAPLLCRQRPVAKTLFDMPNVVAW